jgi:hypothetical protein
MRTGRYLLLAVAAVLAAAAVSGPRPAPAVASQLVASDSYYRLDPPNATMSARVEMTVANDGGTELPKVLLWAMPGATNVAVAKDGTALETQTTPADGLTSVAATLAKPLKSGARVDLVMTYDVPAQVGDSTRLEPGAIESWLVGQGPGSFVYIDLPAAGDNFLDPGCLLAADQPGDVRDSGYERWICGEALLIALAREDRSVQERCASADDKCRQRLFDTPLSAYVQSITDPTLQGRKEADVESADGVVHLKLQYFRQDEQWANEQFSTAVAAFPKLRELFGFSPGHDTILMRQSNFIDVAGAAGVAFPSEGEVLLASGTGFDREVTVHELAHQWAGWKFASNWLWEGLAEYATRVLAPELGITPFDRKWESFGYKDPLATWYNGSPIQNPNYWYGKAGAFWFAYESAVGGRDVMKYILARAADDPRPLPRDGRWFMDAGERTSDLNLDSLFLGWVFNPDTAEQMLQQRRDAWTLARGLEIEAVARGLTGIPADITANLNDWTFGGVEGQVNQGRDILVAYDAVRLAAADASLALVDPLPAAWPTQTVPVLAGMVADQRQAIDAIVNAAKELGDQPAGSAPAARLTEARDSYAAGKFADARRLASVAVTTLADSGTAETLLARAKEAQANFEGGFLDRVGLFMKDPDRKLADAEAAYAAGDPARAMKLAAGAIDAWDHASSRGVQRLAILFGVMAALCIGAWWLLQRLSRDDEEPASTARRQGHYLPEHPDSSWRDWENSRD